MLSNKSGLLLWDDNNIILSKNQAIFFLKVMCQLPNMQDSDLNKISRSRKITKKTTEVDSVSTFVVTYPCLQNLH